MPAGATEAVTMSAHMACPTRRRMPTARPGSIAALALVLVAAACGTSSPRATPKSHAQATDAATSSTVPPTAARTYPPTVTVAGTASPTAPPGTAAPTAGTPGSIRLVGETGVSPVQLQRAEALIAATITDLKRFQSPSQAYAAGDRSLGDALTGDEHYVNWSYSN